MAECFTRPPWAHDLSRGGVTDEEMRDLCRWWLAMASVSLTSSALTCRRLRLRAS
jgi:hypothetical protein